VALEGELGVKNSRIGKVQDGFERGTIRDGHYGVWRRRATWH
jgi:hypothetical protein